MSNYADLSPQESELLKHLDRIGYTAPVMLQAKFERSAKSIQHSLDRLYLRSLIARPMKGLVVSIKWAAKNPGKVKKLNACLGVNIQ